MIARCEEYLAEHPDAGQIAEELDELRARLEESDRQ
jgi:hypothetical protein